MPSQIPTQVSEPLAESAPVARRPEERELPLLPARLLAVGAWMVAPFVLWAGIIAVVVAVVQRLR